MKVGDVLKAVRKKKGYSQSDVAISTGMKSSSTLSQIENNRQACSLDQLKQLCAVLGVPSSYVTWKSEGHHLNNLYRDQEEEIHDHMKVYESRYIGEIDDA